MMYLKKLVFKGTNWALTFISKQLVLTACTGVCHRPEIPQELLAKK